MIKFSILLPTKDRLELLKHAVKSVQAQEYSNWELIISDNCSKMNIANWVRSLGDERIKYFRQNTPLSVTENWNKATEYATGDYKIMLGDDDALIPGALQLLYDKIISNEFPELIVFPSILYLQPDVDPVYKEGSITKCSPLVEVSNEQLIPIELRKKIVADCCELKRIIGFNMQFYCYSKILEEKIKLYGKVYEPPYPDYYTASLMLYIAEKVLYIAEIVTIIGITPKSYGYYYRNNIEKEGMEFHKEKDYRIYAPESIKDKLCSVDEMSTAGIATFALLAQKIDTLKINIYNYYKAVIFSQAKITPKSILKKLYEEEIAPNVDEQEENALLEYMEDAYANTEIVKRDIKPRKLPFANVSQVLSYYDRMDKILYGDADIDLWLERKSKDMPFKESIYIWGAHIRGKLIRDALQKKGILIEGYIDSDTAKKEFDNLKVFRPEEILTQEKKNIIVSQRRIYQNIVDTLEQEGFVSEDGYWYKKCER